MNHQCEHPDCDQMIDSSKFLCPKHWRSLPRPMQNDINRAWAMRVASQKRIAMAKNKMDARLEYLDAAREHEAVKAEVIAALTNDTTTP